MFLLIVFTLHLVDGSACRVRFVQGSGFSFQIYIAHFARSFQVPTRVTYDLMCSSLRQNIYGNSSTSFSTHHQFVVMG